MAPLDLSHHLSEEVSRRISNPMKRIWKSVYDKPNPNMITLAGGEPHETLFPISSVSFGIPSISSLGSVADWRDGRGETSALTSFKGQPPSGVPPSTVDLRQFLQYGTGNGMSLARQPIHELTKLVHSPPEGVGHDMLLCLGNADAVNKAFRILGTPGDTFLIEEFSFPGVTHSPIAFGIQMKTVKMDSEGVIPEELDRLMTEWDTSTQGRRPHVLYTIPVGQNPTGATLSFERLQAVYKIAQKWDIVIIEDDPYYFLQFGDYVSLEKRAAAVPPAPEPFSVERHVKGLVRSFLSIDIDGRVIRLDTLSKVIAPGMRLGWITAVPLFVDALGDITDSSSQQPSGIGQAFIAELMGPNGWGVNGFLQWTGSIAKEYQRKRDHFLDTFYAEVTPTGYASLSVPKGGMFVWIKIHIDSHPRFKRENTANTKSNTRELIEELFRAFVAQDLFVIPAVEFAMIGDEEIPDAINYFRATFSGTNDTMTRGIQRFTAVLQQFFQR